MARGKSKKKSDPRDALINAAMALAARERWQDIRMPQIATEAGLSLPDAVRTFPNKSAVLTGLRHAVDSALLSDLASDPETGETAKDRVFDVVMRRFDALHPYKQGLAGVSLAMSRDPLAVLCRLPGLHCSMALTMEAAGISTAGPCGRMKVHGLTAIYLNALRVWFRDDSPDMAKTMAAVDKGLATADRIMTQTPKSPGDAA